MYGGVRTCCRGWGAGAVMSDRTEKILRALTKTADGPFRVIAYGVAKAGGPEAAKITRDLRDLSRAISSAPDPVIVVDEVDPLRSMTARNLFRRNILSLLQPSLVKRGGPGDDPTAPLTGRGAPERARERLADVAAALPRLLEDVDRLLAGPGPAIASPEDGSNPFSPQVDPLGPVPPVSASPPAPPEPSKPRERVPLFLAHSFEDLGPDVGIVAELIETLMEKGAHVILHDEHLDTRTREGRLVARTVLRLGAIKAERARERSMTEFVRRRESLRVYGPVPFGFKREGQELLPLEDQISAVRRARMLAGLGQTPMAIAATLNHEKRSWKDGTPWTWRRVAQVLRNPIYDRALSEASA